MKLSASLLTYVSCMRFCKRIRMHMLKRSLSFLNCRILQCRRDNCPIHNPPLYRSFGPHSHDTLINIFPYYFWAKKPGRINKHTWSGSESGNQIILGIYKHSKCIYITGIEYLWLVRFQRCPIHVHTWSVGGDPELAGILFTRMGGNLADGKYLVLYIVRKLLTRRV